MPDIARSFANRTLILLSNREPYEHRHGEMGIDVRRPPGGLVTALDPTMQATDGVWVAWGSGSADAETADHEGRLRVPPGEDGFTLRRVFLTDAEVDGYYMGFSNRSLWPLCHMLVQHFEYRTEYWNMYQEVNSKFAHAVADEVRRAPERPIVWIQDYHFALAAEMLREQATPALIHQFWHIPFPPADILRLLPTGVDEALLRGLLGNDLIEFHTERYALNFLGCVAELVPEAEIDADTLAIHYDGRRIDVAIFPISIDVERYEQLASTPESTALVERLRKRYAGDGKRLGLGVDRVDYTKGIPERLRALCALWEHHPEMRERFTFLLVARRRARSFRRIARSRRRCWPRSSRSTSASKRPPGIPIVLIHENVSADMLAGAYRAADLCLVSSLQDGMNLVAKEFIACQTEERGVLVLSRFAGASEEIDGAVLINPFNLDGFVEGIRRALHMSEGERRVRMHRMRRQLHERTIFDWLSAVLTRAQDIIAEREPESGVA